MLTTCRAGRVLRGAERPGRFGFRPAGLPPRARPPSQEIGKADDWGLRAADFDVPHIADGTLAPRLRRQRRSKLAQAVLKYARYARGGRINPASISQLMDQSPTLKRAQVGADRDCQAPSARCLSALAASQARAVRAVAPGAPEAARRSDEKEEQQPRGGSRPQRQASSRAPAQRRHGRPAGGTAAQAAQSAGRRCGQRERL